MPNQSRYDVTSKISHAVRYYGVFDNHKRRLVPGSWTRFQLDAAKDAMYMNSTTPAPKTDNWARPTTPPFTDAPD